MPIVVNGTTLTDVKVSNLSITKVYARQGNTGTYILVFEKGGAITVALYFCGNWKMNKLKADIDSFFSSFNTGLELNLAKKVIIFPPACYLDYVKSKISNDLSNMIGVGIQNLAVVANTSGAYTGQISAEMAADCGCEMAMIGNADCRVSLGITDSICNIQIKSAISAGLAVLLCVGEPEEIRNAGTQEAYVANQLQTALAGVSVSDFESGKIIINYEPIWAIGTGKTCSPEDASQMCTYIKSWLVNTYGADVAEHIIVVYGGSIRASNINDYLSQQNISGAVAAGAALSPTSFAELINIAGV